MGQGTTERLSVTRLLDINVLMALAWPQHAHRPTVNRWVASQKTKGTLAVATCPLTELGFVRVSMNIKDYAADFRSAWGLLKQLVNRPEFEHCFWADDIPVLSLNPQTAPGIGPNQLTDIYLTRLAEEREGVLLTLDTGIRSPYAEIIAA